jgi:hypothetical protein
VFPLRSGLTAPLTSEDRLRRGEAMSLHKVGLACTSLDVSRISCLMKTAAAPAFTNVKIRPWAPLENDPALSGL